LVAGYVGQTAIKTRERVNQALGGVLFIDEAYALSNQSKDNESKDFGQEAIDELVEALTAHLGEFSCIVAGYPDDMEQFLEANEGLRRRFPQLNAIQLDNYNDKELKQIFLSQLDNIQLEEDLEDRLDYFFNKAYSLGFTSNLNAGFCVELAEAMKINMHSNQDKKLKIEHIPDEYKKFLPIKDQNLNIDDSIFEELDKMIGLQNVKDELRAIVNSIRVAMHKGDNITIDHYAFIGNPGTGKTTVAKIVGDIFKKMNLLNGKILITKDEDFIGRHVGDTPEKSEKTIQKAMGISSASKTTKLITRTATDHSIELSYCLVAVKRFRHPVKTPSHSCCLFATALPTAAKPNEIAAYVKQYMGV
jgi:AAA+ superfamily predicted ATPase